MLDIVSFMLKNTVKRRRSRWAGHVEHKGYKTIACRIKVKVKVKIKVKVKVKVKIKIKFALEQATKAQRG